MILKFAEYYFSKIDNSTLLYLHVIDFKSDLLTTILTKLKITVLNSSLVFFLQSMYFIQFFFDLH